MTQPKDDELIWIGIDLDNCLANNSGYPNYQLTIPTVGAVEAMWELQNRGLKFVLYTARSWADYRTIEEWLDNWGFPKPRLIICGKMLLKWMVDDKAIAFSGDWKEVLNKIGG